jgi:hypothetical protein
MSPYNPTTEEIDALYKVMPHAIDIININEQYFYDDEETTDADRKKIHNMSRDLYKSALKMRKAIASAIYC